MQVLERARRQFEQSRPQEQQPTKSRRPFGNNANGKGKPAGFRALVIFFASIAFCSACFDFRWKVVLAEPRRAEALRKGRWQRKRKAFSPGPSTSSQAGEVCKSLLLVKSVQLELTCVVRVRADDGAVAKELAELRGLLKKQV